MKALILVLAHANADQVNCVVSHRDLRTPLHLACSTINLPIAQLLLWVSVYCIAVLISVIDEKTMLDHVHQCHNFLY